MTGSFKMRSNDSYTYSRNSHTIPMCDACVTSMHEIPKVDFVHKITTK